MLKRIALSSLLAAFLLLIPASGFAQRRSGGGGGRVAVRSGVGFRGPVRGSGYGRGYDGGSRFSVGFGVYPRGYGYGYGSYGPAYGYGYAPVCRSGFYDRYGYWHPNPACYAPYPY